MIWGLEKIKHVVDVVDSTWAHEVRCLTLNWVPWCCLTIVFSSLAPFSAQAVGTRVCLCCWRRSYRSKSTWGRTRVEDYAPLEEKQAKANI